MIKPPLWSSGNLYLEINNKFIHSNLLIEPIMFAELELANISPNLLSESPRLSGTESLVNTLHVAQRVYNTEWAQGAW